MDFLGPLALTLAVVGAAILTLPFLDPKDDRARIALFGICIFLTWRYVVWRFAETLPPLALSAGRITRSGLCLIDRSAHPTPGDIGLRQSDAWR